MVSSSLGCDFRAFSKPALAICAAFSHDPFTLTLPLPLKGEGIDWAVPCTAIPHDPFTLTLPLPLKGEGIDWAVPCAAIPHDPFTLTLTLPLKGEGINRAVPFAAIPHHLFTLTPWFRGGRLSPFSSRERGAFR